MAASPTMLPSAKYYINILFALMYLFLCSMRLFVILTFILCKYLFSITSVNMLPKIVCTYISCLKVNGLNLIYGYT